MFLFAKQCKSLSLTKFHCQGRHSSLYRAAWTTHAVQMLKHLKEMRWVRAFSSSWLIHFCCQFAISVADSELLKLPLQDKDGHAVILALKPISKGEEVPNFLGVNLFHLCNQDKRIWWYAMLPPNNGHSRLPSPTSTKIFHTRRGRRSLQITDSHVHAPNAKKSDRSERRQYLDKKWDCAQRTRQDSLLMLQLDDTCSNEYQCSSENGTVDHVR